MNLVVLGYSWWKWLRVEGHSFVNLIVLGYSWRERLWIESISLVEMVIFNDSRWKGLWIERQGTAWYKFRRRKRRLRCSPNDWDDEKKRKEFHISCSEFACLIEVNEMKGMVL